MTPMATIPIPARVLAAIYQHARATFPDECCGYLVGPRDAGIDAAVQCRNAQRDGEHPTHPDRDADTGFVIAGAELLAFARSLDGDRPARVVYHSHTNGRAYFSEVDRQVAGAPPHYPVQHLVVGVTQGGLTEAAQFAWSDEAREFVEVARWPIDFSQPLV
ncbi:MAG TPA: Mov34/MPN/PAD-1 family protein [Kofleriaceae bacterium]|nr:Mov34/MPN/PAD-1 family protein [Kofleriaceae bacterium]